MRLEPLDSGRIELVAGWLRHKENSQWLDFGRGQQVLDRLVLQVMAKSASHFVRVFSDETGSEWIGVVALSDISSFKTALLWYVLGDKRHRGRGLTATAVAKVLGAGFAELGLHAVHAWAVPENRASVRILEKTGFKLIGRQRQCHYIDGRAYDRLLYDLLKGDL